MEPPPFTAIARVVRTHGLAGELSCTELEGPLADLPSDLHVWFTPPPSTSRSGHIVSTRPGPKGTLVTLREISSLDDARPLQGCQILAATSDLPENWLTEEEPDLLGIVVTDVDRGYLGEIADVIITGANDVWVVRGGPLGEILLPVIDDVVLEIDEDAGHAQVRLLPGLIEEG
jgi:16S rRNA processing protein RimM